MRGEFTFFINRTFANHLGSPFLTLPIHSLCFDIL
jgi:hypothetical protein